MRATQFAQLSAFVAVAEHRNFTKAATHLGLSPPSLSQTVRALETGSASACSIARREASP
jgi:DNA-binding transcriptional regulator YdaS (Cro superfamily)